MSLTAAFSDKAIIRELCRARVTLAGLRRDSLFFHNICPKSKSRRAILPQNWGEIPIDIFPARTLWHRFRPPTGRARSSEETNLEALERAMQYFREREPHLPWVIKLNKAVTDIRQRALSPNIAFRPPDVVVKVKDAQRGTFRALTVFQLSDKVIDCITARYLRRVVDPALSPACLAFRSGRPQPSIHTALHAIHATRLKAGGTPLFVSECDIKGFFDCVAHDIASESLAMLLKDAKPARVKHVETPGMVIY